MEAEQSPVPRPWEAPGAAAAAASPSRRCGGLRLVLEQPHVGGRTPRSWVPGPSGTLEPSGHLSRREDSDFGSSSLVFSKLTPSNSLLTLLSGDVVALMSRVPAGTQPPSLRSRAGHRLVAGSPARGGGLSQSGHVTAPNAPSSLRPSGLPQFSFLLVSSASFSLHSISSNLLFQPVRVGESPHLPGAGVWAEQASSASPPLRHRRVPSTDQLANSTPSSLLPSPDLQLGRRHLRRSQLPCSEAPRPAPPRRRSGSRGCGASCGRLCAALSPLPAPPLCLPCSPSGLGAPSWAPARSLLVLSEMYVLCRLQKRPRASSSGCRGAGPEPPVLWLASWDWRGTTWSADSVPPGKPSGCVPGTKV